MTTLHDLGGVLGRPLDTFFWAPTFSWSQLLASVRSGPNWLVLEILGSRPGIAPKISPGIDSFCFFEFVSHQSSTRLPLSNHTHAKFGIKRLVDAIRRSVPESFSKDSDLKLGNLKKISNWSLEHDQQRACKG